MPDKPESGSEAHASSPGEDSADANGGRLALNTLAKQVSAAIIAVAGALGAISPFTGPFARTRSQLILITVLTLALVLLAAVSLAALYTFRSKKITRPLGTVAIALALALATGTGMGYLIAHHRPAPAPPAGSSRAAATPTPSGTPVASGIPARTANGYAAQVTWTDDGGGGGSYSTTLYSFSTPYSHVHEGAYPLGETITVICLIPSGRAIQVGPAYQGPQPHSRVWYQMDNGAWVPAVYIRLTTTKRLPACN